LIDEQIMKYLFTKVCFGILIEEYEIILNALFKLFVLCSRIIFFGD